MANLIIKSSADNLVLQGSDASPAITVGATGTTEGIATRSVDRRESG